MKAFIQEHTFLSCFVQPFTYSCCENCIPCLSNFLFLTYFVRSLPNGNCLFSTVSFSLVGDNSLVHELRVMVAVELHLNATYHAQHPALKSVYE